MIKPEVTVIIPLLNPNSHLLDTLESIRKQSYKRFEILCGNATSDRKTTQMLTRYAKRRSYVRVLRMTGVKTKQTLVNQLAVHARGRFVARIDAGDIAVKTRLARQIAFLSEHPEIVAVGGQQYPYKKYAHHKPLPLAHEEIFALSFLSLAIYPSTMMVNTQKLPKNFRWYNQSLEHIQEFDFIVRLMAYGKLANLPETLSQTHRYLPLQRVYQVGEKTAHAVHAFFHAITRYGVTPNVRTFTKATSKFLL